MLTPGDHTLAQSVITWAATCVLLTCPMTVWLLWDMMCNFLHHLASECAFARHATLQREANDAE